ncbi:MAG: creatininase family protein, partial [Gemmatimonadetes bacterium]|nr:creatininase family protein [Gemmatimonadota bacterium]
RELQPKVDLFLCEVDWYKVVDPALHFEDLGDHAGEMETSVMQHIASALVLPLGEAGDGSARVFRVAALRERWAWAPRQWTQVSADTGIGDPGASTPEKGREYVTAVVSRIAGFLTELAAASRDDMYQDPPGSSRARGVSSPHAARSRSSRYPENT